MTRSERSAPGHPRVPVLPVRQRHLWVQERAFLPLRPLQPRHSRQPRHQADRRPPASQVQCEALRKG